MVIRTTSEIFTAKPTAGEITPQHLGQTVVPSSATDTYRAGFGVKVKYNPCIIRQRSNKAEVDFHLAVNPVRARTRCSVSSCSNTATDSPWCWRNNSLAVPSAAVLSVRQRKTAAPVAVPSKQRPTPPDPVAAEQSGLVPARCCHTGRC